MTGDRGREATYRYDSRVDLVYSKDVDGNEYRYEYDTRHNMTRIRYNDDTTMDMSYYPSNLFDNVRSVKDRGGEVTSYAYLYDERNRLHYTVKVDVSIKDKQISSSSYEYFIKKDDAGSEWTSRLITILDGDKTDTIYNRMGLPVAIHSEDSETLVEYDDKGNVTKKVQGNNVTEMTYNDRVNKVASVRKYTKDHPEKATWSKFEYHDKGNLLKAENSEGKSVQLTYDNTTTRARGDGRARSARSSVRHTLLTS